MKQALKPNNNGMSKKQAAALFKSTPATTENKYLERRKGPVGHQNVFLEREERQIWDSIGEVEV